VWAFTATELERLYSSLSAAEKDDFLQEILVGASHGPEVVQDVLDAWLLTYAVAEEIEKHSAEGGE